MHHNNKTNSILMVVENHYPFDIRVSKEIAALKKEFNITVVCLKSKDEKYYEKRDQIEVIRIPELPSPPKVKNKLLQSIFVKAHYIMHYFYFTTMATLILLFTVWKNQYKVIHVHNPPDTLFVLGLLAKLFSIHFVFDHHDLSPELYLTRFSGEKDIFYSLLLTLEKFTVKLADIIITTNNYI